MTEADLPGHGDEAHQPQRPGCLAGAEADLDQVFGLVHLHRVPGEQRAEIGERDPPEPRGAQRPAERPVDCRPGMVDDVGVAAGNGLVRRHPIRLEPQILGPALQQQIERHQDRQDQETRGPARGAPPHFRDQALQPGQDHHRAEPDPGKGNAQRQPAPAHKPVGQVQGLPGIGEAIDPAADQRAQGQIKLPWLMHQCCQQQSGAHQHRADLNHQPRSAQIHQPPDHRRDDRGHQKPEREGAGGHAALPAELVEDRRKQQRKGGAGVDPDRHRHKGDRDQQPAVKERQAKAARPFRQRSGCGRQLAGCAP